MGFLNKVMMLGNVTRNPEVRYIPGRDLPVAKFGLAVNRKTKDKEETCFIDIVTFGRTAEMCGEYVTKGMPLLIEGRLSYNTWEQEGQKRSKHEVVAENIQFVSSRRDDNRNDSSSFKEPSADTIDEDDIPF
ncbi:single-strand binding protein [Denitrovibrio acetiphilus DSM 12809]|uniref:Single-stranded DNA-binding protein n=1 Tax=Denitrovibrio acetiphilus (strain DSM 12809 / NBRC 114555 / N2460) TaxID=522772 RepID=D4H166_DENA2|nr:single-stranded DNA-binding protein [Denitrovibrio acetiphilus]ADD66814.1 single-strand binding protein [Denitrovibrio acetiphilus DSM 12809]